MCHLAGADSLGVWEAEQGRQPEDGSPKREPCAGTSIHLRAQHQLSSSRSVQDLGGSAELPRPD